MGALIVCQSNVERYYGDNGYLLERYAEIQQSGECSFCPDGLKSKTDFFVCETDYWTAILNEFPYPASRLHLLLIPKRHTVSSFDLKPEEWADIPNARALIIEQYPYMSAGLGWGLREGELGGVTLYHLHIHLIVPQRDPATDAPMPVMFKIG